MEYRAEGEEDREMEDVTEWDPDEITRHATKVTTIKEKLYERASKNITSAQKKDKEYYDKKRCDSQVSEESMVTSMY